MVTAESVKAQLVALVNACKQVTGISSNDLTTQVNALLSAYSGGTLTTITLLAANWVAVDNMYAQVVEIAGVTANSRVDMYPSAALLTELQDAEIALTAENDGGVVTVYAMGGKPSIDMEIQVSLTEVTAT